MSDEEKLNLQLNRFFDKKSLSDFPPPPNGVICLKSDSSIHDAFNVLFENNFLAAPIEDVEVSSDDTCSWIERYPEMIDMLDIVTYACSLAETQKHAGDFGSFMKKIVALQDLPLKTLIEKKAGKGFHPISEDSTFLDALIFLGKYHARRLFVFSNDPQKNDIVNIVTQSAMCRHLVETLKIAEFAEAVSSKTVAECGLNKRRTLYFVDFRSRVIDAFDIMVKHGIGAVPVIDKEGAMRLIGNISARDVKIILKEPDALLQIYQPVYQFLASKNAEFDENIPEAMIVCRDTDTVQTVLLKLVRYKIHRIYLVDAKGTFQNIISLTDLLRVLVSEPKFAAGVES